jgi:hypothetical protein
MSANGAASPPRPRTIALIFAASPASSRSRPTAARDSLAPRPGQPPPARGDAGEVSRSLLRVITLLTRYTQDTATAFIDIPRRAPAPSSPWGRARAQALRALASSAASLHRPGTSRPVWPGPSSASPLARRLDELATALATGRDLLYTHFAPGPGGGRAHDSPWALAITSERLNRALLAELGALAQPIAHHGANVALAPGPGTPANAGQRRALNAACQWLHVFAASIQAASRQEPVPAADRDLLAAIPAHALPARPARAGAQTISGLCDAVITTAARLRHLAWHSAQQPSWSPGLTITSLRQAAETSTLTSHHCALLNGLLADTAAGSAFPAATRDLAAAARAAHRAGGTWYQVARRLREVTTDTRGQVSPAAAEARDLAWWTGRLAHADPAWALTSGPHSPPRRPHGLVPEPGNFPHVVAAVHQAAEALALLADTEHHHLRGALHAERILVPTRTLASDYDIPRPYGPAPEQCTGPLLARYQNTRTASCQATTSIGRAACATGAPSRVLATAPGNHLRHALGQPGRRHASPAPARQPGPPTRPNRSHATSPARPRRHRRRPARPRSRPRPGQPAPAHRRRRPTPTRPAPATRHSIEPDGRHRRTPQPRTRHRKPPGSAVAPAH